jgi:thioredoxin-related protein
MRACCLGILLVLIFAAPCLAAESPTSAEDVVAAARAQATEQHKNIFLIFGASWCGWCRKLDAFLASPQVKPIIEKHFVIARVTVAEEFGRGNPLLNSPGGEDLVLKLGGEKSSVPFVAFLDQNGELIINSLRPVGNQAEGENIGFPTEPEEIDWFLAMLRKATADLTLHDAHVIEKSLRAQ